MQTPKIIAKYEKRIKDLESMAELQNELIEQQRERITYLERYCEIYQSHISSLEDQLNEAIAIATEMSSELNGNQKQ